MREFLTHNFVLQEVQKIIKRSPKARDALRDIEEEPIASASMGQVHIAYLKKTGEKVVIKVQHPHASTLLTDDFRTLLILARVLTWTEPEYGFFELLMKEWAAEAVHELDFMTEASNLQSAKLSINNMEKVFGEKGGYFLTKPTESYPISMPFQVEIPIPKLELCTKELIVMTFCEGVRMDSKKVKEWGIPNPAMMDAMVQALSHLMYTSFVDTDGTMTSIFSGDPHAGNQLVRKGTSKSPTEGFTLVLLDWGLAKRMPEMKRYVLCIIAVCLR